MMGAPFLAAFARSGDFDFVQRRDFNIPLPPRISGNIELAEKLEIIHGAQAVAGKIFKTLGFGLLVLVSRKAFTTEAQRHENEFSLFPSVAPCLSGKDISDQSSVLMILASPNVVMQS